jgi:hypothetical protein
MASLYRIKYILGSMVAIFSLVYVLFGIVGWIDGTLEYADLLTCFVLASLHLGGGGWLLISSLKEYRVERRRIDTVMRHLIHRNGGRVIVSDLARLAEISDEDAREYLVKRTRTDVSVVLQNTVGEDVYFFGQQFWNN